MKTVLCLFVLSLALLPIAQGFIQDLTIFNDDPDTNYNITELIRSKGYNCEEHTVVTEDGYILGVFRIPSARGSNIINPSPVVLQHGLLDAGTTWVVNLPDESLGFLLADAGYDVWIGNSRGSYYSRQHKTLNPDHDHEFWNFTWDDMAEYDIPALVDYVISTTGRPSVGYVGHSQGTTQMFAYLTETQETFARKINFFAALAPVAHVGNATARIAIALNTFHLVDLLQVAGIHEFMPSTKWLSGIGKFMCGLLPWICENIFFLICGFNDTPGLNMNATRIPVYVTHAPAGTSLQNMQHWAQSVKTGKFQHFDYGNDGNMARYGQVAPPAYELSNIHHPPIALFTGSHDALSDPSDILYLLESLPLQTVVHINNNPHYQHLDYVWGADVHKTMYPDILKLLDQYSRFPPN